VGNSKLCVMLQVLRFPTCSVYLLKNDYLVAKTYDPPPEEHIALHLHAARLARVAVRERQLSTGKARRTHTVWTANRKEVLR